jgi:alkylation response protein AidB-like acyl-CoA dehydrogenase
LIPRTLFSPEHEDFRESVRKFIAAEIVPNHDRWEEEGIVPREIWRRAGEMGLLCATVPEAYGGQGGDFLFSLVVGEEMARAGTTGPYFHLHSDVVTPYVVRYGSEEQKQSWLPRMVSGEAIAAIAMTEPGGGSDLQAMETTATRDGGDYVISGQKVFISNGQLADVIVVAAKTDRAARAKGVTLFLVDTTTPGFDRGRSLKKIGLKAQDTSELFFAEMRVPASAVLGEVGAGFRQLMTELAQERLVQACRSVTSAEAAIEWTVEYTRERQAFGGAVSDFQNTRFAIAQLVAETTAQRAFVDRCVALHLEGQLSATDAAIAKLNATDLHCKVVDECLQLHGGWGYMWEYPIARAYADARQARLAGGTTEVMKRIIARDVYGPEGSR